MANQPKKYTKFVAAAATATLVASAIVPVASAAGFSDVADTNSHAEHINALVDAGVIRGFEDGTFKPGQTLTRGQVVKMLGKWVEAQGFEAPADYTSKARFNDVATNAKDQELVKYAALVADTGVFNGSNGELNAGGNITRENMALVLDRAFKAINKVSLVELAADVKDAKVNDLSAAKAEAREAIQALRDLEISVVENFNPKNTVTRGQFASFLNKTINTAVELTVKEAIALDAETVEVTLSNDTKHTVKLDKALEANKATEITFTINDKEYKATVTYVVDAAIVTGVEALNAKQIKVSFSKEIEDLKAANVAVVEVANTKTNAVTNVEVSADKKSAVLTLTDAYRVSTDVAVTVDGVAVKGSVKETFAKFSKVVTINDTTAPAITSVTAKTSTTAAQLVTVEVSEPLKETPVFKVNGVVASASLVAPTTYVLSGLNLAADKEHTLEVIGMEDNADHKVAISTKKFSVTTDTTVATGAVKAVQDNKIQITFDKKMNAASLANIDVLYYNGKEYAAVTTGAATLDESGKVATLEIDPSFEEVFFGTNDSTEELIVKVKDGVLDSVGNKVSSFESRITVNKDVTGPALTGVTAAKNSKGEAEKLFFEFTEELSAAPTLEQLTKGLTVVNNSNNQSVAVEDVLGKTSTIALATDNKTVVVTLVDTTNKLVAGSYNFELAADVVTDGSFGTNGNKKATVTAEFGAVTKVVTAKATTAEDVVTVTFDKAVTAESAKNPANYSINGVALPANTVVTVTDTTAVFTIPAGTISKNDKAGVLTVSNIQAQNPAYTFENLVTTIDVTDNVAPTVAGKVLSNGVIELTFSEALSTVATADFPTVRVNGLVIAASEVKAEESTLNNGEKAVVLTVAPTVATVSNVTYLFIDVDGNGTFNGQDIELSRSVAGPIAEWSTTVADLNNSAISTVTVETAETTTTADTEGNKLKAGSTITIK